MGSFSNWNKCVAVLFFVTDEFLLVYLIENLSRVSVGHHMTQEIMWMVIPSYREFQRASYLMLRSTTASSVLNFLFQHKQKWPFESKMLNGCDVDPLTLMGAFAKLRWHRELLLLSPELKLVPR